MTGLSLDNALVALGAEAPQQGEGLSWFVQQHWPTLVVVGALVVVTILLLSFLARFLRLTVNMFLDIPLPMTANLNDYTPPSGEIVSFPSRDGHLLRGMFVERPAGAPDRGTIVFCHEFASDMLSVGRYATPLVEAGYTVFTFDFRGHGQSSMPPHYEPRHWPSHHDVNDLRSAIAYVKTRCPIGQSGVGVFGVSRGGAVATIAAALSPAVRCLVLDGAFSTDYSIEELMRRWAEIFVARVGSATHPDFVYRFCRAMTLFYVELKCRCRYPSMRRALAALAQVPALFISGERDTYVRPEQTRTLCKLKPGKKELWICPDAKHNQAVAADPQTYAEKITSFFDHHLPAPAPAGQSLPAVTDPALPSPRETLPGRRPARTD
ncbi:MAG: alpha/beta fold hydrolase [Phycisphaerae bacterium]